MARSKILAPPQPPPMGSFHDAHQQALELDLWVLSNTLSRNHSAHRRTIHFQRLGMAKACFLRYELNTLFADWNEFTASLKAATDPTRGDGKNKQYEEKDLNLIGGEGKVDEPKLDEESLRNKLELLLQDRLIKGVTEFSSRSLHASKYGMVEMARGYFLPFLTVSFAALARLRVLGLRLQQHIKLVEIPQLLQEKDNPWISMLRDDLERLMRDIPLEKLDLTYKRAATETDETTYASSMASLGLTLPKSLLPDEKPKKEVSDSNVKQGKSGRNATKKRRGHPKLVDHGILDDLNDIGEALALPNKKQRSNTAPAAAKGHSVVDPLDGNAEYLKALQEKRKAMTASTSSKRRKSTEEQGAKKKSKKRKKKDGGGDFFDQLFG